MVLLSLFILLVILFLFQPFLMFLFPSPRHNDKLIFNLRHQSRLSVLGSQTPLYLFCSSFSDTPCGHLYCAILLCQTSESGISNFCNS